jgi:hypothetical protein
LKGFVDGNFEWTFYTFIRAGALAKNATIGDIFG